MESNYIYTIRPKDSLKALITQYGGSSLFLQDPIVWIRKEGGFSHWSINELLLQIKLLFLVYLITALNEYPTPQDQEFLKHIIDEPPFDVSIFDKWWDIERSEIREDFDTVIRYISIKELKRFSETGNFNVDNWFAKLTNLRESGVLSTLSDS